MDKNEGNEPSKQHSNNNNNFHGAIGQEQDDMDLQEEEEEKNELNLCVNNNEDKKPSKSIESGVILKGTHLSETDTEEKHYDNENENDYEIGKQIEKNGKSVGKQVTFKESIENLTIMMSDESACTVIFSQHTSNDINDNELEPTSALSSESSLNLATSTPISEPISTLDVASTLAVTEPSSVALPSPLTQIPNSSSAIVQSPSPIPIIIPVSTLSSPFDDTGLSDIPSKCTLSSYPRKLYSADDLLRTPIPTELEHVKQQQKYTQMILKKIERDTEEMAGKFHTIMQMFDVFSKKLDALDSLQQNQLPTTSGSGGVATRRKYIREPKTHVSRYAEYCSQVISNKKPDTGGIEKVNIDEGLNVENEEKDKFKIGEESREALPIEKEKSLRQNDKDVITSTPNSAAMPVSCASLSCQTSWHDTMSYSIIFSSRNASPSNTSRSEVQNSLNNFAAPEAAIVASSQTHLVNQDIQRVQSSSKEKLIPRPVQPNVHQVPTTVQGRTDEASLPPCNQQYHTIHIDAPSSPPSSVVQRPSLCSRLWDSICDMCAAVCLCLQVNRDCIFCLGFFAAFVVSASFLTAFFYRTLSVSSTMPSTTNQPLEKTNADLMEHFNGYFRQVTTS